MRWMTRVAVWFGAFLALVYATVWAVPPLHQLAIQTVITTRHSYLARLIATPSEFSSARAKWLYTPDISTVTRTDSSSSAAAAKPPLSLQSISGSTYQGWVLLVRNPAWVHVAVTKDLGVLGEQVSQFGEQWHALASINGGGFVDPNGEGTGGLPVGVTASFGKLSDYPDLTGDYVIGFNEQNQLEVGKWNLAEAETLGLRDAVSFKPLLVVNGQPQITEGNGGWGIAPRTAIGQRADGTVIFVVIDGRQPSSLGATLLQVQNIMLSEGAVTAVNLDGGSSTTLYYDGKVINSPCCSPQGQRYIATAFVVVP